MAAEEMPLVAPVYTINADAVLADMEQLPPAEPIPAVDPHQARAVDAVFTQNEEAQAVAALLGLWTSTMLLHDLAKEHFDGREEDEAAHPRLRPDDGKKC
jgi:hypothetical protein